MIQTALRPIKSNLKFLYFRAILLLLGLMVSHISISHASEINPLSDSDVKLYEKAFTATQQGKWDSALKHIKKAKNPLPAKAILWQYYKSQKNKATFNEITSFINANTDWPYLDSLRKQAEQRIKDDTPESEIFNWFSANTPQTSHGLMRYADLLKKNGKTKEVKSLIRTSWLKMDMNKNEEKTLYKNFKKWITKEDNEKRLERLLWDGKTHAASRQARLVNKNLRSLAKARIALHKRKGSVDNAIARVPSYLKNHPGLVYERMRWRAKKGRDTGAIELLQQGVDESAYPKLWWKERGRLARRALKDGKITLAYELAANHQAEKGFPFADAEWLAGWIALRYLDQPSIALKHFIRMHDRVSYPVSLARGGYWAGRAALKINDLALADIWFKKAAQHTTSFYGQLAADYVNINERPLLPTEYTATTAEQTEFNNRELIRLIPMLAQVKAKSTLKHIMRDQIKHFERESDFTQLALLAHKIGYQEYAVYAAREGIKRGFVLINTGYPVLVMPKSTSLDNVLAMSIIRQESAFQIDAKSRVGARGLMQLMPATAKNTAKAAKLKYNKTQLSSDGTYNIQLGSFYLNGLIKRFNGSLPMAFAGYNAGPSRSKKWAKENGDPRLSLYKTIDWIELIPFNETQNYVQRVLENMVVYQKIIDGQHLPLTQSAMNKNTLSN